MLKKLQKTYGFKHLPNEERFYEMFKVSRKDFYQKLESAPNAETVENMIMETFYSTKETTHGRRGVMGLSNAIERLRRIET